jgi:hypothetical protein
VDGWQQAMWAGVVVTAVLLAHILTRGPLSPAGAPNPQDRSEDNEPQGAERATT